MWIKDKNSSESYIHVCEGLKEKQMRVKKIEIRLHDLSIFTFIELDKGGFFMEHLKYCPYCGIKLLDTVE
jgi:hypothetical protein